jgi:zinc transport system substrate-binding protein
MKKILILLFLAFIELFAMPKVAVSIAPQKYFVKQIMGEDAEITILVPNGSSPATYAPKPSQLKALSQVSLYFTIGVAFEKHWLRRFKSINHQMRLIDTTKGIQKITMQHHADATHAHHTERGLDPHVWLSPLLVIQQAKNIKEALIALDKPNQEKYEKNFLTFKERLKSLHEEIDKALKPLKKRDFIVFHPSFGYFAKEFSLKQVAIEREGKEPSLRYLKRVIDYAKSHHIKAIFVAPQFSQKAARQIAKQVEAKLITIDPLSSDWEENIRHIAKSFYDANSS